MVTAAIYRYSGWAVLATAALTATGIFPAARADDALAALGPPLYRPALQNELAKQDEVIVTARRNIYDAPAAQTATSIGREQFEHSTAFSIGQLLTATPGVTVAQGNGPRDVSISVRGSNARQTFGVRNVQVFEDGFPMTQPDGLARTDLVDPHVYSGIDVLQGPASALYGNYATGGAIQFRSRTGAEIDGVEAGVDGGRFNYLNTYLAAGARSGDVEYALFASRVSGDGATDHTGFTTDTVNLLASYSPTAQDTFTVKFIHNTMDADVSVRLSLDQYRRNPYQKDCSNVAVAGCAPVSLYNNGRNGARGNYSADAIDIGRYDRRTIGGLRWEHAFDAATVWRTQVVADNRDIKQPTGASSSNGTYPSLNLISDITRTGELFGWRATHFAGVFANYEDIDGDTYNVAPTGDDRPAGRAALGALTQAVDGSHFNYGARVREELQFDAQWRMTAGLGIERTELEARQLGYSYPTTGAPIRTRIDASREFFNAAPELGLIYQPDPAWRLRARLAGGYGTPQVGNLFITANGLPGNNTELDSQRNRGLDLGADWEPDETLKISATLFYERFSDELVSQSPGPNLQSFTFNAPRSVHRGALLALDWRPLPQLLPGARLTASYLRNDQYYAEYVERISTGGQSASFDRAGNKIPGVAPAYVNARAGYEQGDGALRGLGGFVELDYRAGAYADNGNLLKIPGYTLFNANLHYDTAVGVAGVDSLRIFLELRNLFNHSYVASASNLTNTIDASGAQRPASTLAATSGSIWAGAPRTLSGGVRLKF